METDFALDFLPAPGVLFCATEWRRPELFQLDLHG